MIATARSASPTSRTAATTAGSTIFLACGARCSDYPPKYVAEWGTPDGTLGADPVRAPTSNGLAGRERRESGTGEML